METQIGINITSSAQLPRIAKWISCGQIDFVELLIDNFFHCAPDSFIDILHDIPVALHIMRSHFIERNLGELKTIGKQFKELYNKMNIIYISDHVAKFYYNGLPLPIIAELSYQEVLEQIIDRVSIWQEILNTKLLIENFPSMTSHGLNQPYAFHSITRQTGCGILFDISNAIVANRNTGVEISQWSDSLGEISNFHAAAYATQIIQSKQFLVDSHDGILSQDTLHWVSRLVPAAPADTHSTIVFEYDDNINYHAWEESLMDLRKAVTVVK